MPVSEAETVVRHPEEATTARRGEEKHGVLLREGPLVSGGFPDRYTPEAQLGEGGMGSVVLLEDRLIGRRVAAKLMKEGAAGDQQLRDRFVREAQVQGQLEHPAIVPVYDMGVDPSGAPFFTMKRVRGVTLGEILDRHARGTREAVDQYPRRRLLSAFASVCLAVDFAHQLGVLHRDLKPSNLMLGGFGEVYVLDWGIAKIQGAPERAMDPAEMAPVLASRMVETLAGAVLGTPGYMAPEQLRGEDSIGPTADVYALGAILFELLTLKPLNEGATPEAAIASTLTGADARPSARAPDSDVAPELEAICVRATAQDPSARFASARELHEAVDAWLGGELDVELRRRLATSHAELALKAAAAARSARDPAAETGARREAMRAIGRALALDPSNEDATQAMMALLRQPPGRLPPEVGAELDRAERDKTRKVGRFGAITYGSLVAYVPLLIWMGVRSLTVVVLFYAGVAVAVALSVRAAVSKAPSPRLVLGVMMVSNAAFALTATFFGPLLFTPGLIAINTSAFMAHAPRAHRWIVLSSALVAVLAPFVLQLAGVLPPSYAFTAQGMLVLPGALPLAPLTTTVFLAISAVVIVVVSAASVVQIRDALGDAERRLMVHTWHMRELAPSPEAASQDATAQ